MSFITNTDDTIGSFPQKRAIARYKGRFLNEKDCVGLLWQHGVLFSITKGKARRISPLPYLEKGRRVPLNLKWVILTKSTTTIGNKLWGRIDFLVNYCGYQFVDER